MRPVCLRKTHLYIAACAIMLCSNPTLVHTKEATASGIDGQEVWDTLNELAQLSDSPKPSVTRLVYSKQDIAARKYIMKLMQDAGLTIRVDAVGNTFGLWEGSDPGAGKIMSGSHADSIIMGGVYDGALGVVGAIAAVAGLRKEGFQPRKSIEVVQFTSEEGDRFTEVCFGSRIATGGVTADELAGFHDENGTSFKEAATGAGFATESYQEYLDKSHLDTSDVDAFVELHIEQGPLLENEKKEVGIVTGIFGPSLVHVQFNGSGGHGGGMPMEFRNDPSLAAAEVALLADKAARSTGSPLTVATTGTWNIHPNVFNAVPRGASILIDIRDVEHDRRQQVIDAVLEGSKEIGKKWKTDTKAELVYAHPPIKGSDMVLDAIRASVEQLGFSSLDVISKPYHDAAIMGTKVPVAMIFVPCRRGLSHHPDEFSSPEQVGAGVKTLALTLAKLAGSTSVDSKSEL